MKLPLAEICEDKCLQDSEILIRVDVVCRTQNIIINQLTFRFVGMNKVVSNSSILHALNDSDILKKAAVIVSLYKKNTSVTFAIQILSFRSTF